MDSVKLWLNSGREETQRSAEATTVGAGNSIKPPGSENPGLERGRPLTWGAGVLHDVRPVFLRLILDRRQRKGQSELTIPGLEFKANLELPYRAGVREVKLNVGIQVVGLNPCRVKKKMYSFLTEVSTKTNRIHHNFHKYKIKLLITGECLQQGQADCSIHS